MPDTPPEPPSGRRSEHTFDGVGAAPGIGIGTVYRYEPAPPGAARATVPPDEVEGELSLLDTALQRAREEVKQVRAVAQRTLGEEGAAIFGAQLMMLRDETWLGTVRERIRTERASAPAAVRQVLDDHRRRLDESSDPYLRGRSDDLDEVEMRLQRALRRGETAARIAPNALVVAETLTAADVVRFSQQGMLGFATDAGGATSHAAILARALGVPAVVGADGLTAAAETHDHAIVDGLDGRVVLHPTSDRLDTYRQRRARHQALQEKQARSAPAPAETTDGHTITVRANVEFGAELESLGEQGAEGIGLMRTEMLFLNRTDGSLSEDQQAAVYRKAGTSAAPHGATIRLLDLGGDKLREPVPDEPNPALGWRGVRLLLDRPDELLRPQLRALLRANTEGALRVLVPMVSEVGELRRVRAIIEEEVDRLSIQGVPHDPALPLGAMVEVPATALRAGAFAEAADFLSIGTNDLTQYVLAVDRDNDRVARRFDALHPAVLQLVRRVADAGRAAGTPVLLCGEIAADVQAVPILVGLGLTTLSASPTYIPALKHLIRHVSYTEAQALAEAACDAPDAETVRQRAHAWLREHTDTELYDAASPPNP